MTRRTIGITGVVIGLTATTLVLGCGSSPNGTTAGGASARQAAVATEPVVDCPNATLPRRYSMTFANNLDIPITISSGGADLCASFSGAENPTTANGRTIAAHTTLIIRVSMHKKTARWSTSFLAPGDQLIGRVGILFESWNTRGDVGVHNRSVQFQAPGEPVTQRGIGSIKVGGVWREIGVSGGLDTTALTVRYVR